MMVKNLFVLALFVGACSAMRPIHFRAIGNVATRGWNKARYLGSELAGIKAKPENDGHILVKFPPNPTDSRFLITGMKTVDFTPEQIKYQIVDGGIGSKSITIKIKEPRDKDTLTEFHFYGQEEQHEKAGSLSIAFNKFLFGEKKNDKTTDSIA